MPLTRKTHTDWTDNDDPLMPFKENFFDLTGASVCVQNTKHVCPNCQRVVGYTRACAPCHDGKHNICCCGQDEFCDYLQEVECARQSLDGQVAAADADDSEASGVV